MDAARRRATVVEHLLVTVSEDDRDAWLDADARTWTAFLERQGGFLGKEVWTEEGEPDRVHVVIWWADEASWKAVPPEVAAEVDARMGHLHRPVECVTHRVLTRAARRASG